MTGQTCEVRGCHSRAFMDTEQCFDHQPGGGRLLVAAMIAMAVIVLTMVGVCLWATIELVEWVTSK